MAATIVCHGWQSHLESQLVESRGFRLPSTKPLPSSHSQPIDLAFKSCLLDSNIKTHHEENINNNKIDTPLSSNPNIGGWSFLEALSNVSNSQGTKEPSAQYVHPQQKHSSLVLSPRSLELCTENLGSESGTDIVANDIDMLSSSDYAAGGNMGTREQRQPRQLLAPKKGKDMNFPPPLTTIRGSESLRVRPHREDGRLVIEVTKAPPMFASCFHAERSHGRLRLRFLNSQATSFDPEEEEDDDDAIGDNDIITNGGFDEEFESEMIGLMQDVEEEEMEEEEDVDFDVGCGCECEMRMEKYERPRTCKEGGEHENNELLLNWGEPLWVVTS